MLLYSILHGYNGCQKGRVYSGLQLYGRGWPLSRVMKILLGKEVSHGAFLSSPETSFPTHMNSKLLSFHTSHDLLGEIRLLAGLFIPIYNRRTNEHDVTRSDSLHIVHLSQSKYSVLIFKYLLVFVLCGSSVRHFSALRQSLTICTPQPYKTRSTELSFQTSVLS